MAHQTALFVTPAERWIPTPEPDQAGHATAAPADSRRGMAQKSAATPIPSNLRQAFSHEPNRVGEATARPGHASQPVNHFNHADSPRSGKQRYLLSSGVR